MDCRNPSNTGCHGLWTDPRTSRVSRLKRWRCGFCLSESSIVQRAVPPPKMAGVSRSCWRMWRGRDYRGKRVLERLMNEPASSSVGPFGVRSVSPKAAFRRIGFIATRKTWRISLLRCRRGSM